jgi:hypothetical protein
MTDIIRPISRNDAVDRVQNLPRTKLLTPEEREEARREREALRKRLAAKEAQRRAD